MNRGLSITIFCGKLTVVLGENTTKYALKDLFLFLTKVDWKPHCEPFSPLFLLFFSNDVGFICLVLIVILVKNPGKNERGPLLTKNGIKSQYIRLINSNA